MSERSVRHWANAGKLPCVRTATHHRLFPADAVAEALAELTDDVAGYPGTPACEPAAAAW